MILYWGICGLRAKLLMSFLQFSAAAAVKVATVVIGIAMKVALAQAVAVALAVSARIALGRKIQVLLFHLLNFLFHRCRCGRLP
jgi:hypothetical protein